MRLTGFAARSFLAAAVLFAASSVAGAGEAQIEAGEYDGGLMLGYDPSARLVSGYFRSETGGGRFSCIFYFTGALNGKTASIQSYFPDTPGEVIEGLFSHDARAKVSIYLKEEHGGCWNVLHFADKDKPAGFSLSAARPWKHVRVIRSDRAHFFNAPESRRPRKGYVVKGDALGVKSAIGDWLEVDYTGGGGTVSGWIGKAHFFPVR